MDSVTTICVFLMLFGIVHTKDWKPEIHAQGENATVRIDQQQISGKEVLEITFSGYTSKLHVTNVMLYDPKKNQTNNISINTNYTGRTKMIEMNNGSLRFLLLNVNFMDSGNYTVFEDSLEKGKTSILVARHRLLGQNRRSMILPFMCNITNTSSIKIEMITKGNVPVVKYYVTKKNCTEFGDLYTDRIEGCVLRGHNFSFTIRNVSWLDKGMYVAWDDTDSLIDSAFVEIREDVSLSSTRNGSPASSKFDTENVILEWYLVSAVVVLLVAGLIINAVGKLRQRRVSKTTTNNLTHRNGIQNTANSSRNWFQNVEKAHTPEETRMVLTESNNSDNLTDFTYNKSQIKVRENEKHLCARGIDSAKSAVSKLQIHSILPSSCEKLKSEPAQEYDHVHEYDEPQTDCWSDQSYLRSKLLSTNPTENIAEQSYKNDYLVHHSHITLRPPAPDPVVTKKTKEQVTVADSFSRHTNNNKKSPSRVDPSTLYAKVNQKTHREIHCTGSSANLASHDFRNKLAPPSSFELEDNFSMDTLDSPNWSQRRRCLKERNSECFDSKIYVHRPESSELQAGMKSQIVSHTLNYDCAGNVLDDSSARKRRHRRSQSYDSLYGILMANSSVRLSRRSLVRPFISEDCYDSL